MSNRLAYKFEPLITDASQLYVDKQRLDKSTVFHTLLSPEFLSLVDCLNYGIPNNERGAMSLIAKMPSNTSARSTRLHLCRSVFFFSRRCNLADQATNARTVLTYVHHGEMLAARRELDRYYKMEPVAAYRCCGIRADATHWVLYDSTNFSPVLPKCKHSGEVAEPPRRCDGAAVKTDAGGCCVADGPITEYWRTSTTPEGRANYQAGLSKFPTHDRLSHFGYICEKVLESIEVHLCKRLPLVNDKAYKCELCVKKGTGVLLRPRALLPDGGNRYCYSCLNNTIESIRLVRKWGAESGVVCSGRMDCQCIYDYALKMSCCLSEFEAIPEPADACYEEARDSLYDKRSSLVRYYLTKNDEPLELLKVARLPKEAREPPLLCQGFTFGRRFNYQQMLEKARTVYEMPTAGTLSVIGVNNLRYPPYFFDENRLEAAMSWLPRQATLRMVNIAPSSALNTAKAIIAERAAIFSSALEELIYEELTQTSNRRVAMARLLVFAMPPPVTVCAVQTAGIYLITILAIIDVCERVAGVADEEASKIALREIMEADKRRHDDMLQQAKDRRLAQKKKQQHHTKAVPVEKKSSVKAQANENSRKYSSQRVIARARDPVVQLSSAELQQILHDQEERKLAEEQRLQQQSAIIVEHEKRLLPTGDATVDAPEKKKMRTTREPRSRMVCKNLLGYELYDLIFNQ
jgi:hypothetical protein